MVSGKGGVGKTVISSALGLLAARRGQNALIVKMDDQGRLAQLFGVEVADRVVQVRPGLSAVNLDAKTVVADYFHRQLRIKRLVRHILDSSLFDNWFRVSPAIKEMILLGKVWSLVEEASWWRQSPVWDLVIFDAPATGHGLGYLQLPEQAGKLLLGPMRKSAESVRQMLADRQKTGVVLVTIPEDMPVNEAIHFYEQAQANVEAELSCVVLNMSSPDRFPQGLDELDGACGHTASRAAAEVLVGAEHGDDALGGMKTAARFNAERARLTQRYQGLLRERVALPRVDVPHVFAPNFGAPELEQLADLLEVALKEAS